jgi:hypothetical protein
MCNRWTAGTVLSGAILALLPVLGVRGVTASAQAPKSPAASSPAPEKIYTNKTVFLLPIKIDERLRADLREVLLYVKDGAGEWQRKDSVPATQSHFTFHVPHDGEYWFSVVTVDKKDRFTPADVSREPPGLMVVVDTRPKDVKAPTAATPAPTPTALPTAVTPPAPAATIPASMPMLPPAVPTPPAPVPAAPQVSVPAPPPACGPAAPNGSHSSPAVSKAGTAKDGTARTGRQLINTTRASIDYRIDQIGPSGVSKVEIWLTADEGHTWQRFGEDVDHRSPAEITLPGEGVFGFRLVVTNGNGFGGKAPVSGDAPSNVIEVDMTKPFAQLREIEPVGANGMADIRWTASDKNLGPEPVNLYYAPGHEGPWLPVATNLKNDGLYRWSLPRNGVGQFLVRLEVTDLAGNVTRCETQTPVVLDTTEPQVQVLGVSGVQARGLAPSGN